MARQQARRRRRERAVGVVIVLLGAAVLIVAIVALREPKGHVSVGSTGRTVVETLTPTPTARSGSSTAPRTAASSQATASSASSASTPAAGVKSVPLVVLNNSGTGGLARAAAQRFRSAGWTVGDVDNLPDQTIISTCAYYDPSVANARAAAEALQQQFPTIKRVKEKFAGLPSGPVVVVLTSDYSSG